MTRDDDDNDDYDDYYYFKGGQDGDLRVDSSICQWRAVCCSHSHLQLPQSPTNRLAHPRFCSLYCSCWVEADCHCNVRSVDFGAFRLSDRANHRTVRDDWNKAQSYVTSGSRGQETV